jgi:hypothetical protein
VRQRTTTRVVDPAHDECLDEVDRLLWMQSGVIARRQLLAHGVGPAGLERALRRRDLTRVLPGVFVDHTGDPTGLQRAWAGVLYAWPTALCARSALRMVAGPRWRHHDDDEPVEVGVDVLRTVRPQPGVRPVRITGPRTSCCGTRGPLAFDPRSPPSRWSRR